MEELAKGGKMGRKPTWLLRERGWSTRGGVKSPWFHTVALPFMFSKPLNVWLFSLHPQIGEQYLTHTS